MDARSPFDSSIIMIVDREPATAEVLRIFLRAEGYNQFVTTPDSLNEVALAKLERPDVLLLELTMPAVNGLEVLREIRRDEELQHLPTILLTSATGIERSPFEGSRPVVVQPTLR